MEPRGPRGVKWGTEEVQYRWEMRDCVQSQKGLKASSVAEVLWFIWLREDGEQRSAGPAVTLLVLRTEGNPLQVEATPHLLEFTPGISPKIHTQTGLARSAAPAAG